MLDDPSAGQTTALTPVLEDPGGYAFRAEREELPEAVDRGITVLVDRLVNDWLKANPRR